MDEPLVEKYSLKDVWQFFLEAVCRFWSNRFKEKQLAPEVELLKLELESRRLENAKLVSTLIELSLPKKEEPIGTDEELKPIRQFQPSWDQRRKELELESRRRAAELRQESEEAIEDIDSDLREEISNLEREVGVR